MTAKSRLYLLVVVLIAIVAGLWLQWRPIQPISKSAPTEIQVMREPENRPASQNLSTREADAAFLYLEQVTSSHLKKQIARFREDPYSSDEEMKKYVERGIDLGLMEGVFIPRRDVSRLAYALERYFEVFQQFPSGDSAQISRALLGDNPKKQMFYFPRDDQRGMNGVFLDAWGLLYRFEITGLKVVVRSAGRDRFFGNADDLVAETEIGNVSE